MYKIKKLIKNIKIFRRKSANLPIGAKPIFEIVHFSTSHTSGMIASTISLRATQVLRAMSVHFGFEIALEKKITRKGEAITPENSQRNEQLQRSDQPVSLQLSHIYICL